MEALVQLRQHLHRHPESAFEEYETAKLLKDNLRAFGYLETQFVDCAAPGFYVDLQGSGEPAAEPRCIALRTELDALKMSEENYDLEYRSVNPNAAHMCGHEGHATALIGVAKELIDQLSLIPSNCKVRLLFQPAEEIFSGARKMIAEGCLEGVDEIYACHNMYGMSLGQLACIGGVCMASIQHIKITVKGKGGHGANPEMCTDVVLTACEIVSSLANVTSRAISCHDEAVLTICKVDAGSAPNVMPDEAVLEGTIRTFDLKVLETIKARVYTIVTSISAANDCIGQVEYVNDCPPTINHVAQAQIVRKVWAKEAGEDSVLVFPAVPGSEDFSYYLQEIPGAMFALFSGEFRMLHSANFNFSDALLPYFIRAFLAILSDRFGTDIKLASI